MLRIGWRVWVAAVLAFWRSSAIVPASAGATLVFTRNPFHPAVFAARDNGKGVHRIGAGYSPHISPDGRSIALPERRPEAGPDALPAPTGRPSRILMQNWRETFYIAFSPDSKMVAAERGAELGKRKLVVIDLATGRQQVVAQGFFSGFSFSPDSSELAYSKSGREFSSPATSSGSARTEGARRPITDDHRSIDPLWGPDGRIVFDQVQQPEERVRPQSAALPDRPERPRRQAAHPDRRAAPALRAQPGRVVGRTADGCWPSSAARTRATRITVNPRSGAARKLVPGDFEQGFVGGAISKDGKLVLGTTGGEEPAPNHHIAVVPYSGGKQKVIVADGYEPDWSR